MSDSPHNDQAERSLLGALLINPDQIPAALESLKPEDFYRPAHGAVFRAIALLHPTPVDMTTLTAMLDTTGELEMAGGLTRIAALLDGVPRSSNAPAYTQLISELARRRRIIAAANALAAEAGNGVTPDQLDTLLRELPEAHERKLDLVGQDLSPALHEDAGTVTWLAEGLIPKGELILLSASWKTAKTLISYALVLDALSGAPIWGHFALPAPLRVSMFQFEMPFREDARRLRRLALGAGYPLGALGSRFDGALSWYSRPALDLADTGDIARFRRLVEQSESDLVVIDSLSACMPAREIRDNTAMRQAMMRAFAGLTDQGISVLVLHHYRKPQQGGHDDPKAAVIGAQAIAATASRVYGLDRMAARSEDAPTTFRVILSLLGAWTPADTKAVVIGVEDTAEGDATTVTVLSESDQLAAGGMTKIQQGALNYKNQVIRKQRIPRADALAVCQGALGVGARTAEAALAFATSQGWVQVVAAESNPKKRDLIAGEAEG